MDEKPNSDDTVQDSVTRGNEPTPIGVVAAEAAARIIARAERVTPLDADQVRKAERSALIESLIWLAGERYRPCRLENFVTDRPQQRKVVAALEDYVANAKENLEAGRAVVLYGPCGTGKDHLMFGLVGRLVWRFGCKAAWINGQDWYGDLRDAMDRDEARFDERNMLAALRDPSLLAISDPLPPFGELGQHMASMFYRLIDGRYRRCSPTFLSVNVADDEEAYARMGVASWDRLRQEALMLHCNWPSYRKPAREVK